jgi:hypothetical protein
MEMTPMIVPGRTVVNKRISRRQLLRAFAKAAGGIGLIGAFPFLIRGATSRPSAPTNLRILNGQPSIYDVVRAEATAANNETNRPLPLVACWSASTWWNYNGESAGFYPGWQLEQMAAKGYHLCPWFNIPIPSEYVPDPTDAEMQDYLNTPINRAKTYNLPIIFVGAQWEQYLYTSTWLSKPKSENPNVWDVTTQAAIAKLSPFGAISPWYNVGYSWGSSTTMQQVIRWYPTPPLVIFTSNNEAETLKWTEASTDQNFCDTYPSTWDTMTDAQKRHAFAAGWKTRYDQLIAGFRAGFQNTWWESHSVFTAYQAIYPGAFGRFYGWKEYSSYDDGNMINWQYNFFDGGLADTYSWPSGSEASERDNTVEGPLFQCMNFPFMINEAHSLKSNFRADLILWHGDIDSWAIYPSYGQTFTPDRYEGMVQFAMWINTPRIVWEYEGWEKPRSSYLQWLQPIINAVDRVWNRSTLQSFWRNGTLVVNPASSHPYQTDVPPEYSTVDRMFLLTTSLDPATPWAMDTQFEVMALARRKGTKPSRQWLLYAHAPTGARTNVQITIPDYKAVTVNVALAGSFYLIDESTNNITPIN